MSDQAARSRVGESMRADFACPFDPPTATAVCVKERGGYVTCHIDEGRTLTAYAMPASKWDVRRENWIKAGSPKP